MKLFNFLALFFAVLILNSCINQDSTFEIPYDTEDPEDNEDPDISVDSSLDSIFKIIPSEGNSSDYFGNAISTSSDGKNITIGKLSSDLIFNYKWNGTNWIESKITASDSEATDQFGRSLSMSGDGKTIVVGAPGANNVKTDSGAIYVYKWTGADWIETKLVASSEVANEMFGYSIDISDENTIVVGAYKNNENGYDFGAIYILKWDGSSWAETKIFASDSKEYDLFGISVSISNDGKIITVGSQHTNDSQLGSFYIYKWNGTSWIESTIAGSNSTSSDRFGNDVSISGDGNTIAVGAYLDDNIETDSGSVYLYKWNGINWIESKIIMSAEKVYNHFGGKVSLNYDGNIILIGAHAGGPYNIGIDAGAAYLYKWNGANWQQTSKLLADDGEIGDRFGGDVSISDNGKIIIIGATGDNDRLGSAYIQNTP